MLKQPSNSATIIPNVEGILKAQMRLKGVVMRTPLTLNTNLSEHYGANIFLKREDLQVVRSYKIRGAFNKISTLSQEALKNGVVCASAGNHAQGLAYACNKLGIQGTVFMPVTAAQQKVKQVKMFGKNRVVVQLVGDTFDDAFEKAQAFCEKGKKTFVHPFNDEKVMEGQGTIGLEILEDIECSIDYLLVPVGGGGLIAGVGAYFKQISPSTKIIGVEPAGAPAMDISLKKGKVVTLDHIDKFVDGAAVRRVGEKNLIVCQDVIDQMIVVPEGKVCSMILKLYNEDAIVVEPAGALSIAGLDFLKDDIKGKNVVCIISGSNNDIVRMEEIKERSLLYEGLKHYFIVRFPQRAGALREFVSEVIGKNDNIVHFEYTKKVNRELSPALVGIEVNKPIDFKYLIQRMEEKNIAYQIINDKQDLFGFLI